MRPASLVLLTVFCLMAGTATAEVPEQPNWSLGVSGGVYGGSPLLQPGLFSYTYFSVDVNRAIGDAWNVGSSTLIEIDNLGSANDAAVMLYAMRSLNERWSVSTFAGPVVVPGENGFVAASGGGALNMATRWGPRLSLCSSINSKTWQPKVLLQASFSIVRFKVW